MSRTTIPDSTLPDVQVFGDPQLHTDGDLLALAFGLDGTLWSVEEPGLVRHWNAVTGKQLLWRSLSDLENVWCFSDDARVLASASNDVSLWDPAAGHLLTVVPQQSWVTAVAFHPDASFLATGHDDGVVRYWDATGHQLVHEFRLHQDAVCALAFSADGTCLASAAEDRLVVLWDVVTGKQLGTLSGHVDRVSALAWHPGGEFLVSAGWDSTARVWDVRTLQPLILLNSHATQVTALAFSKDGGMLACADSADSIHLWDFAGKKTLRVLRETETEIRFLAFSQDGQRLACGGAGRVIHVWDPQSGRLLAGSLPPALTKTSISLSADGKLLVSNGGGSAVRVWQTATRALVRTLAEEGVVHSVAYSPDGRWIAGGTDEHVRLWEAGSGQPREALVGSEEPVTTLAFSPDGSLLASASSTGLGVWLWRVADGEPVLLIPDALDGCTVESLAFHPQGRILAVGGIDWLATGGSTGAICLWDLVDRAEVATFIDGTTAIAFDPQGKRLASTSLDQSMCIWDVATQRLLTELTGHDEAVTCLAYSPDGRLLASGSDDHTLRLWDAATGEEKAVWELDSQIKALRFSPDGRYLYTGNGNTTCYQLDVQQKNSL